MSEKLGPLGEKFIEAIHEKKVKTDKEIELPKDKIENKQKPYIYQEIDRLGKELVGFSRKARETKNTEAKKIYEEKAKFFREELEKAKAMRDKIKSEHKPQEVKLPEVKIGKPTELQADIDEYQSKTYHGSNIYTKESTLEDALDAARKIKNLNHIDKNNS